MVVSLYLCAGETKTSFGCFYCFCIGDNINSRFYSVWKVIMFRWFAALDKNLYKFNSGGLKRLSNQGWFPSNTAVEVSEYGSMDKGIISLFVQHLNCSIRRFVTSIEHYVLLLDGHSSRKGFNWLEVCGKIKCEVVQSPANTSHFLQPSHQFINKCFQETFRVMRDKSSAKVITNFKSFQMKLMLPVTGFQPNTERHVLSSWTKVGLSPIRFDFARRWWIKTDGSCNIAASANASLSCTEGRVS